MKLPVPNIRSEANIVGTSWQPWFDEAENIIGARYRLLSYSKDGTVLSAYVALAQNQVDAIASEIAVMDPVKGEGFGLAACQPLVDSLAHKAVEDMGVVAQAHGGYAPIPKEVLEGLA